MLLRYRNIILLLFIRFKSCLIKDTPILMVSNRSGKQDQNEAIRNGFIDYEPSQTWLGLGNSLKNSIPAYAMAALPLVTPVPIQEVQLFDYAVAHKSINSSYGLTASNDDTFIIDKDPYTSDQQRTRDQNDQKVSIYDRDWSDTKSLQNAGTETNWISASTNVSKTGWNVGDIQYLNMPEIGINGPFKITSIKHIIPQKKPIDEDPRDEWEYRPVTGLFIHHSHQVHNITFDNNESIGVTAPHPIFSATANDWRLAGELEIGEKVLTYHGEATVTNTVKKAGIEMVYNLEIKDLHNFLVTESGVVVHNNYLSNLLKGVKGAKGLVGDAYEVFLHSLFPNARKVAPNELFPTQREYDIFFELNGKKNLGEAKSGNALNYDDWVRKYRAIITEQAKDASKNGYEFYLFANKSVPDYVKSHCQSKGIPIIETLD